MYIKDSFAISPQDTITDAFNKGIITQHKGLKYMALEPNYADSIPVKVLRRMGKAVRMANGAGVPLLDKYKEIEGIIIGTAHGGMEDSIKFLNQIIDFNEGTLTPTNFVQSTPNAIAGGLAQYSKCYGYNNTHTNDGLSFEGALIDAKLLFHFKEAEHLLVGAVEEISEYNFNLEFLQDRFKDEKNTDSNNLLLSRTKGTVSGEGAILFYISNEPKNALAEVSAIQTYCYPNLAELSENLMTFLAEQHLTINDIDILISGRNGDIRHQIYYDEIEKHFEAANIYTFKNLVGEYPTVSAFAVWMTAQVLSGKNIPKEAKWQEKKNKNQIALIYNQHKNKQHSFILMKSV